MIAYPTPDDELVESDLFQTFSFDEAEQKKLEEDIPPDYLFRVERFSEEFWLIATKMAQLNDYCVLCLQQTSRHLDQLHKQFKDLQSGKDRILTEYGDFTGETIDYLEEQIPTWKDSYKFISRATCLILLLAFIERSLKLLCKALSPSDAFTPKRKGNESKIAIYTRYLQDTCKVAFFEPEESVSILNKCRKARNLFAHGDWDELRNEIAQIELRSAFGTVAELLYVIEDAVWQSSWENHLDV